MWSAGRTKVLDHYPLDKMYAIDLALSDVFGCGNWENPNVSKFGLELRGRECNLKKYEDNYRKLEEELSLLLRPYDHVFTHNSWGEYGHEEHVQVFRVIETLQKRLHFNLWVPNYVSNRSIHLMKKSFKRLGQEYFCLQTNRQIASQLEALYQKYGCWTWYSDYKWPNEDGFLSIDLNYSVRKPGELFPINYIDIGEDKFVRPFFRRSDRLTKGINRVRQYFIK